MPYINRVPKDGTGNSDTPPLTTAPLSCPEYVTLHKSFTARYGWDIRNVYEEFGIPKFAVLEMLVCNMVTESRSAAGVRTLSSEIERTIVTESPTFIEPIIYYGGYKRMLVQVDKDGYIETYADAMTKFIIMGYWTGRRFIEDYQEATIPSGTISPVNIQTLGISGCHPSGVRSIYIEGGAGVGINAGSVVEYPTGENFSVFCRGDASGNIYVSNPTSADKMVYDYGYFYPQPHINFVGPDNTFTTLSGDSPLTLQIAGTLPPWDEDTFTDFYIGTNVDAVGNEIGIVAEIDEIYKIPIVNANSGDFDVFYGYPATIKEPCSAYWEMASQDEPSGTYYVDWLVKYGTLGRWDRNTSICPSGSV